MQILMVILLFVIASAVAPQAIYNICRLVEWCAKMLFYILALVLCISFFVAIA